MFKVFAHGHRDETRLSALSMLIESLVKEELKFKAKSSWLACYTTCLPTYDEMEISILVESDPDIDEQWHSYFKEFRAEQPVIAPSDWISKMLQYKLPKIMKKNLVIFRFPYSGSNILPTFRFFADGRFVRSNIFQLPKRTKSSRGDSLIELEMELSYWKDPEQKELSGLLYRSDGWPATTSKFYRLLCLSISKIVQNTLTFPQGFGYRVSQGRSQGWIEF